MSLDANMCNGCNRLVVENDIAFINTILYWNGLCKRER